VTESVENRRS